MKLRSLVIPSLIACACTPGSGNDDGSDSSSSASSDGSTTQGPGESESTVGETDPGPTSSSGTEGNDSTETGEPDECEIPMDAIECQAPGETELDFDIAIDGEQPGPFDEVMLDEVCMVTGTSDDGTIGTIDLDCPSGIISVGIASNPHQVLEIGDGAELALYYWAGLVDEANQARRMSLRWGAGGPLAFAAFDDTELPSPAELDVSPLDLALPATTCETYIDGEFGILLQPAGLQVSYDGTTVEVFEGGDAFVGQLTSYRVLTDELDRIHCFPPDASGYNYANWFVRAMFFQIPEG